MLFSALPILWLCLVSSMAWAEDVRPNLILLSMDTTRADALSCYGQPGDIRHPIPDATPNLDLLAEEGIRFTQFYTHAPTTLNAHSTMMTGLDPHAHGVPANGFPLAEEFPTLAERLARQGYQTIAVVGAGALQSEMGLDRGFEVYDDTMSVQRNVMFQDTAEGVVARVVKALGEHRDGRPLFLFVHFYDPHGPLTPESAFKQRFVVGEVDTRLGGEWNRPSYLRRLEAGEVTREERDYVASLYLAEVSYMDHHIGSLLRVLEREGSMKQALVVATADHGQILARRGRLAFTHGYDVSREVMHVPLIFRGYGIGVGARRTVNTVLGMSGLAATIERTLGLAPTLGNTPDFWGLVRPGPVWDGGHWPTRPAYPVHMEATRSPSEPDGESWNNWRYHRGVRVGPWMLYRYPLRPKEERRTVFKGTGAMRNLLDTQLRRWDAQAPPYRPVVYGDETREMLRALGYLPEQTSSAP